MVLTKSSEGIVWYQIGNKTKGIMNGEKTAKTDNEIGHPLNGKYNFEQGLVAGYIIGSKFDQAGENAVRRFKARECDNIGLMIWEELIKLVGKNPVPGFPDGIPSEVIDAAEHVCMALVIEDLLV